MAGDVVVAGGVGVEGAVEGVFLVVGFGELGDPVVIRAVAVADEVVGVAGGGGPAEAAEGVDLGVEAVGGDRHGAVVVVGERGAGSSVLDHSGGPFELFVDDAGCAGGQAEGVVAVGAVVLGGDVGGRSTR